VGACLNFGLSGPKIKDNAVRSRSHMLKIEMEDDIGDS
jgi:hypothetical protein